LEEGSLGTFEEISPALAGVIEKNYDKFQSGYLLTAGIRQGYTTNTNHTPLTGL
jgi:hypothetical protein